MQYQIEADRLVITATDEERALLAAYRDEVGDDFDSEDTMYDLLERLTTDDCFQWIDAGVTGDITAAPILAILGDEEYGPDVERDALGSGLYPCGRDEQGVRYQPVLYRWGFMDYAVTTPQRELLDHGRAVFTGGELVTREGQMGLRMELLPREFTRRPFALEK